MTDDVLNPAAVIFIIFMVAVGFFWFCLPPLVWEFTDESDIWYKDDYKLNRNECIEIFHKNKLSFCVREEDFIHSRGNDNEEENFEATTEQNVQGDDLIHDDDDHVCIDVETGDKSVLCINIVEKIGEGKNHDNDTIEISGGDHDRDDIDNNYGEDNATTDSDNGVVLRIPRRANSFKFSNRDTVPMVCAICLDNFKVGDELAFSSNRECSHVFHLECITEYIGKTKGAEKPCPCCRQWFLNVPMISCDKEDREIYCCSSRRT